MLVISAPLRRAIGQTNVCGQTPARWSVCLLLLLLSLVALSKEASGQSQTLTVRWDAVSGDVGGYVVYLGSVPGSTDTSIDVRRDTSYTIQGVEVGRAIYISVAAYSSAGVVGPRTPELFFDGRTQSDPSPSSTTSGALPCLAGRAPCPRPALASQSAIASLATQTSPCVISDAGACYTQHLAAAGEGSVAGLIPLPGGTVLIAERSGRVFVGGETTGAPILALEYDSAIGTIDAAMPAVDFDTSRHIYLLSSRAGQSAFRELRLTRFRLLDHALVDPEPLLGGMTVREAARPLLGTDPSGRIYVGVAKGAGVAPYDGVVVRLAPDEQARSGESPRQTLVVDRLGASLGIAVDQGDVLSLEAASEAPSSGWQLRRHRPGAVDVLYGPFTGPATGLTAAPLLQDTLALVYSQPGRTVSEVRYADGTLTFGDRIALDGPVPFAAGSLADGAWLVVDAEDGRDGYRVYRLRKPQ